MIGFFLKKLLNGVFIILGIITLLFFIFNLLGDPSRMIAGQRSDVATLDAIKKLHRLDQPVFQQYLGYLADVSPISVIDKTSPEFSYYNYVGFPISTNKILALKTPFLRPSFQNNRPVESMLMDKLPGTFILAFAAMFIALVFGMGFGVVSALYKNKFIDHFITVITLIGISAPSFFVAVILAYVFAVSLRDFTHLNVTGYLIENNIFTPGYHIVWKNLLLPAIALGIRPLAIITQLTRSNMIEVMRSDYVRTARSKGLSPGRVTFVHGFRNALNPVVTAASGWFASLLAGAFFIEYIFNWQGLGKLTIDALNKNDYPVILGAAIFIGVIFVLINILVDILYAMLDPRVKISG